MQQAISWMTFFNLFDIIPHQPMYYRASFSHDFNAQQKDSLSAPSLIHAR